MATAVPIDSSYDDTRLVRIVRALFALAIAEAVCVVIVSIITHALSGVVEHALTGVAVYVGAMFTIFFPGTVTRPRKIDGIAAAAGIGLGATWVYVGLDAFVLQPLGVYTNRWHEIGGGSIWWYLPVWWMVGTYMPWMGGWILANQANRSGRSSVIQGIVIVTVIAAIIGALAALLHFPGAGWHVPTFAIAILPALALTNFVTAMGRGRS
ncbi:MAG: hypothetical protein ACREL5_11120 [Gemmatimonadales bacterium]